MLVNKHTEMQCIALNSRLSYTAITILEVMKRLESKHAILMGVILASMAVPSMAFAQQSPGYATYIVHIPANAYVKDNVHWVPQHIAVPAGTTVEFANDDPDQQHTVTSGTPNSPSGLFDSGVMAPQAAYVYTFDKEGEYSYFCKLHPWMIGSVSVSGAFVEGHNLKMSMGNPAVWDTSKLERSLLVFEPTSTSYRSDQPITYNLTILRDNQQVFSEEFRTLGGHLSVELVPADGDTKVSGPDTNEPVTGAYHVQGSFLKANGNFKVQAEITKVVDQTPASQLGDEFTIQVVPEFPVAFAALPMLIALGALVVIGRKSRLFGAKS